MGFDNQPDFTAWLQTQVIAGGKCQSHFHRHTTINGGDDDKIPLLERNDAAGDDVASAQADRLNRREKNVSGADGYAQQFPGLGSHHRGFQLQFTVTDAAGHGAALGVKGNYLRFEDVLESNKLRNGFLARRGHHFVRSSLGHQAAVFQHQHALAQSKDLFAAMRDIEDRDAVGAIPSAQVVDDGRFRRRVEARQRFVEQEQAGIGNQRARQSEPLTLAAGDLPGLAAAQVRDTERFEQTVDAGVALGLTQ